VKEVIENLNVKGMVKNCHLARVTANVERNTGKILEKVSSL
jgi:hypothetical protein